jgi:hypothetical protein
MIECHCPCPSCQDPNHQHGSFRHEHHWRGLAASGRVCTICDRHEDPTPPTPPPYEEPEHELGYVAAAVLLLVAIGLGCLLLESVPLVRELQFWLGLPR